jgi:hypothetical protein
MKGDSLTQANLQAKIKNKLITAIFLLAMSIGLMAVK